MKALKNDCKILSRLTQQAAFDSLRKTKLRWVSGSCVVQAIPNHTGSIGVCVIAAKKTEKSAVKRNTMRRRMRVAIAQTFPRVAQKGMDYMVIARPPALNHPIEGLEKDLTWCLKKMGLLQDVAPTVL